MTPTGFLAADALGHATQTIPFAAHFRSAFLSMVIMFFPSADTFLYMREERGRELMTDRGRPMVYLLLVVSNELQPIFLAGVVDSPDKQIHLAFRSNKILDRFRLNIIQLLRNLVLEGERYLHVFEQGTIFWVDVVFGGL